MITSTTSSRDLHARDVLGWTTRDRMVKSDVERRLQDPFAELFPLWLFGAQGMASNKQEGKMSTTSDRRGIPPEIEMAVAAPDDAAELGFWPWVASFLLGGGVGFICGMQLTLWALAPEVAS